MKEILSELSFLDYYISNVEYNRNTNCNKDSFELDFVLKKNIEVDINDSSIFYVNLMVKVFENAKKNDYPFELKLEITGVFKASGDFLDNKEWVAKNGVAILYPYLRSAVTTYTGASNITPLILPTINVNNLFEEN